MVLCTLGGSHLYRHGISGRLRYHTNQFSDYVSQQPDNVQVGFNL